MKEIVKIKYFSRKKIDDIWCKLKRKKVPLTKLNLVFFQLCIETSSLCSLYDNILCGKYIYLCPFLVYTFNYPLHTRNEGITPFRDPEAEFKEFEPHLVPHKIVKNEASAPLKPLFSGFETGLKCIKFGLVCFKINQYDVLTLLCCDTFVQNICLYYTMQNVDL